MREIDPKLLVKELPTNDVKKIEQRLADIYDAAILMEDNERVRECIVGLKRQRAILLAQQFEWTDENIAKLEAMNERMKPAILDMRNRTIEVYEALKGWGTPGKQYFVEGSLWVDKVTIGDWDADSDTGCFLCDVYTDPYWNTGYLQGVSIKMVAMHTAKQKDSPETYFTENDLLYLGKEKDNWNEHMDREKTANMHIIHPVHNLYNHCDWAIQDLLNIKSYETRIEICYGEER